jgi:cytochrome P450
MSDFFSLMVSLGAGDLYATYADLRAQGPVLGFDTGENRTWVVSHHEEVVWVQRHPELFSSEAFRFGVGPRTIISTDPPDHTVMRRLVSKPFAPRAIAAREESIRVIAHTLLDEMQLAGRDGDADLVRHLAYPLPVMVIAEMLGIPPERREEFKRWSDDALMGRALVSSTTMSGSGGDEGSVAEMTAFFAELVERRRTDPGDDLVSALVTGGEMLTPEELVAFCSLLLIAGNETTTNLISNATDALLAHPAQLARLREAPEMIPAAVEEVLRYDAPVQVTLRKARGDVELGGQALAPGDTVLSMLASANRDERVFPDPDHFDVDRRPEGHLAFGSGIHLCLGAGLARLEARVAFEVLLERLDGFEASAPPVRNPLPFLRGFQRMPVTVRSATTPTRGAPQ